MPDQTFWPGSPCNRFTRRVQWHNCVKNLTGFAKTLEERCQSTPFFVSVPSMNCGSTLRNASCWLSIAVATAIYGCGNPGIPRQALHGRIAGAEGRYGLVDFVPRESTRGPAARASLVNGEYQFSRSDGPVPGDYTVIIQLEVSPDLTSGVALFKGIAIPENSGTKIPQEYESVASLPVSVLDGAEATLQVDLKLPET